MVQYSCSTKQNDNERIDIRGLGSTTSPPVSPASRMKPTVVSPKKSKSTTGSTTGRRTRPIKDKNKNNVKTSYSPLGRNNNIPVKSKSTPSSGGGNNNNTPKNQPDKTDFRKVKPYSLKEMTTRSASLPSSSNTKKKNATAVNGSYSNAHHSPTIKESANRPINTSYNSNNNHPRNHSRMSTATTNNNNNSTGRRSRSNTPTKHRPYNRSSSSRSNTPTKYRRPSYGGGSSTTRSTPTTTTTTSSYSNTHDRNHCQTSTDRPFNHSPTKAHKPRAGVRQQRGKQQQQQTKNE